MSEVTLESLVGEHMLSGVDFLQATEKDEYSYDYANLCVFELDGKVYTCAEDESDGYRSSMKSLTEGGTVTNRFQPQHVLCSMQTEDEYGRVDDLLVMRDVVTGKDVLTIGTENTGDYYPSYVASFQPENMACNSSPPAHDGDGK